MNIKLVRDVARHAACHHIEKDNGRRHGMMAVPVEPAQHRQENHTQRYTEKLGAVAKDSTEKTFMIRKTEDIRVNNLPSLIVVDIYRSISVRRRSRRGWQP